MMHVKLNLQTNLKGWVFCKQCQHVFIDTLDNEMTIPKYCPNCHTKLWRLE